MAIAYARLTQIGRTGGGNAVRSAAYAMRQAMVCERTGERFDYSDQADDLQHHEVILPTGVPEAFWDAAILWNTAQAAERRKDAVEARSLVCALPRELDIAAQIELARSFAARHFVDRGVPVQMDIHDGGDDNPHVHFLIATRRLDADGFSARKAVDLEPQIRYGRVIETQDWGVRWGEAQDGYFLQHGLTHRVDPIAAEPQSHLGPKAHRVVGEHPDITRIREINADLCRDPETVLGALTRNNATFTAREATRYIEKHASADDDKTALKKAVLGHESVVKLYDPETREFAGRYTTTAVREQEQEAMAAAERISGQRHYLRGAAIREAAASRSLRPDQKEAFDRAVGQSGLVIIEGRAGTGKSYTAQAIREAHEKAGYRVIGLAPTNAVVQDMAREGFAEARTVHSLLFRLNTGKEALPGRTLLLVDEAAMVDSRVLGELLRHAGTARAKLVLIGDDRQLASIERGGLFAELRQRHGSAEITAVTRQQVAWQRSAAEDLAAGRFEQALAAFDRNGAITWTKSREEAFTALVDRWRQDVEARPERSRFVFAYTNQDVDALNAALRQIRKERGELVGPDFRFATRHGVAGFAVGDRIQFTATDKALGFANGQAAVIVAVDEKAITAKLDSGKVVTWQPEALNEHGELTGRGFRHGYAGTIYKGQGRTLDQTYLLHTPHWRSAASYVALTRQREEAQIFVASPDPWMAGRGGVGGLDKMQLAAAKRSHAAWKVENPSAAARHGFADYVAYVQQRQAERPGGGEEGRLRRLARQMSRSEERQASIAFATAAELAAIGGIRPEALRAPDWLIPPIDPAWPRPELAPAALAQVRAEAATAERLALARGTAVAYRQPEQARQVIADLVAAHGYEGAAASLLAKPGQAGAFAGKDGWFSSAEQKRQRQIALATVPALAASLCRIGKAEEQAVADHVAAVGRRRVREAVGIPALSPDAARAVETMLSARSPAAVYRQLPEPVQAEIAVYHGRIQDRFPTRTFSGDDVVAERPAGMTVEAVTRLQDTAQRLGYVRQAALAETRRPQEQQRLSEQQRQTQGRGGHRHSV